MKKQMYKQEGRFITVLMSRDKHPNPNFMGRHKTALHGCLKHKETLEQFIKREEEIKEDIKFGILSGDKVDKIVDEVSAEDIIKEKAKCRNKGKLELCSFHAAPGCYNECNYYC